MLVYSILVHVHYCERTGTMATKAHLMPIWHRRRSRRYDNGMLNPWLAVPLSDYEQHMGSAGVEQLGALSDLFARALGRCRPQSVAVLGIAGGNGLDRIDTNVTSRIVGLDINPLYIEAVRRRYPRLAGLELHRVDLSREHVELRPVGLVHAALIFEHAGVGPCLENALSLAAPGGNLSVVLQLPTETGKTVAPTEFPSIQSLGSHFSAISPAWLRGSLEGRGFHLIFQTRRALPAGRSFWMGIFSGPAA